MEANATRREPAAACHGKTGHDSYAEAEAVVKRIYCRASRAPRKMKPYRCGCCGKWHVGGGQRRKRT